MSYYTPKASEPRKHQQVCLQGNEYRSATTKSAAAEIAHAEKWGQVLRTS